MVGANQFRWSGLPAVDRAELNGVSIKRFALSTHVIELDDGMLQLKASSRIFFGRFEAGSLASDRALPVAAGKRNQSFFLIGHECCKRGERQVDLFWWIQWIDWSQLSLV